MPRILLLILLVWVLYLMIKRFKTSIQSTDGDSNSKKQAEKFVVCSQCQCHVPESDSHMTNNVIYCSNPECDAQRK